MIIGLTGRIAAGKGEIVNYLTQRGFQYCTISQVIRGEAAKINLPISRESLQDLGNLVRKYEGRDGWIKRLIGKLDLNGNNIVDGIRNPGEVEGLRKVKDFYLISIDAPQDIRFERVLKRNKPSDPKTWDEFVRIDNRDFGIGEPEDGQQVGKCIEMADYHVVNDQEVSYLISKVESLYTEIISR